MNIDLVFKYSFGLKINSSDILLIIKLCYNNDHFNLFALLLTIACCYNEYRNKIYLVDFSKLVQKASF